MDGMSFNFDDMTVKANQYLDQIRDQAQQMLNKAREEAAVIRKQAEVDGRQAAINAAEKVLDEKVSKQLAQLVPALRQAVDTISQSRQQWLAHWEKTAIHVSAAMAARAIRRELRQTPELPLTLIRESLELAAGRPDVQLLLNPKDYESLGPQVQKLIAEISRLSAAKVVADPSVSAGGCRVLTKFGVIDQTFEAQLARMEEELT